MGAFLKDRDENIFFQSYDGVTGEVKFTKKQSEAKLYNNDWFARTELNHLLFHFPEHNEQLKRMVIHYT